MQPFANTQFSNPILKGSYPDPSITYDGEYFYIVNSSFEYFPALPIHQSKDLVNWELVAYALSDVKKASGLVNLVDVPSNGGIHAPTIRYHQGKFYVITTNVYYNKQSKKTDFVNFVMTADKVDGYWDGPFVIEGTPSPGIDPDIFFDGDKVYYVGQGEARNPTFDGEGEIWIQEMDPKTFQFIDDRYYLWTGTGGLWAEGPHMYKYDNHYYLMIAEGGTSFEHAVTIARSKNIYGPYESNLRNPIITTRHLSYDNWVNSVGHGDMVEVAPDKWYIVLLGKRNYLSRSSNMGRETHLAPVVWEREPQEWSKERAWPVVAPNEGSLTKSFDLPFPEIQQIIKNEFKDSFEKEELNLQWNFRRIPLKNSYSLRERKGYLRLYTKPQVFKERSQVSLLGFRQRDDNFVYTAKIEPTIVDEATLVGITMFLKDDEYVNLLISRESGIYYLNLMEKLTSSENKTKEKLVKKVELINFKSEISLKIKANDSGYEYFYLAESVAGENMLLDNCKFTKIGSHKKDILLALDHYTGTYLGLYATSRGTRNSDFIDVSEVYYKGE